jgi:uncharacterized membrane protein YgdD (TMEM256/DUF423 family)
MPGMRDPDSIRPGAWLAAFGALSAGLAVALAAYAAHAAQGADQSRLQTAAAFAFGHGLALAALAPAQVQPLARWALRGIGGGALLFAGSLVGGVLGHWPTTLAPLGGLLMIGGWLALAFALLRR